MEWSYVEIGLVALAAVVMASDEALRRAPTLGEVVPRLRGLGRFVPAILVSVAAMLYGAQSIGLLNHAGPTPAEPTQPKAASEFVKNQQLRREPLVSTNQNEWWDAISYHGEYVATGKHLVAYLEYQSADFGVTVKPNRVPLRDLRDFVRNGDLQLPVMMREVRPDGLYNFIWGADTTKDKMLFVSNIRGRIVFVDDNGKEQKYYFLITGGTVWNTAISGGKLIPHPDFVAGENLAFPAEWEAFDAQH
jgi:hypothetical protein